MGSQTSIGHSETKGTSTSFYKRNGFTRAPVVVQWMATLKCSLSCAHCLSSSSGLIDVEQEMPRGQALELVDQVAELGVEELLISGGEPLERADLPRVIEHVGHRGLRYSLNTARRPSNELLDIFRENPPCFVAVSLDGPRELHDSIRGKSGAFDEAIEAISLFSELGIPVAAGTTVTRLNQNALTQMLEIVARSGAKAWGMHLLIPEGRAAHRPKLFLHSRELKRLLRFVAEKRTYFPVEIAEELGYCGELEPFIRDLPTACGAGRTQCVILPSGDVVPCTTLDLSTSAGNLGERTLDDIWRTGFAELRHDKPSGKCRSCEYFAACGGGCWLQRRNGTQCFKDVWRPRRRVVNTAASVAVALGLAALPSCTPRNQPTPTSSPPQDASLSSLADSDNEEPEEVGVNSGEATTDLVRPQTSSASVDCGRGAGQTAAAREIPDGGPVPFSVLNHGPNGRRTSYTLGTALDSSFFYIAIRDIQRIEPNVSSLPAEQLQDPGFRFLQRLAEDQLPNDLEGRVELLRETLCTRERSLGLSAALWRMLSEPLLSGPPASQRSPQERALLRDAMFNLAALSVGWRRDIFVGRLDPFLAAGRRHQGWNRGWMLKSGPPPPPRWLDYHQAIAEERWGRPRQGPTAPRDESRQSTTQPSVDTLPDEEVTAWLEEHPQAENLSLSLRASGPGPMILSFDGQSPVHDVSAPVRNISSQGDAGVVEYESTFTIFDELTVPPDGEPARVDVSWQGEGQPLTITIPPGTQLTYMDLLRLVNEEHGQTLEAFIAPMLTGQPPGARSASNPLLLPAFHAHRREANALIWLTNFWLF